MQLHNPHQRLVKRLLPRFSPTWLGDPNPAPTTTAPGVSAVGPPAAVTTTSAPASPTPTPAAPTPTLAQTTTQQTSATAQATTPTTTSQGATSAAPASSTTPLTSSTDLVSTSTEGSTTIPATSSTTPLASSNTPRASAAQGTSVPGTVTARPSSVGIRTMTNASGGIIYSTIVEAPAPTASTPASPSNVGTIVGAVAGGLVGVVCLIAFISWLVRQHNKRKHGNSDDFDRQSYLRNSMMIPDDTPGAGRPVIGTQAALALARANNVGPRPPTMIERKPTYLMTGQPSPSYAPGQVVSFEPGQVVSAPSSAHGYPSPMAFAGYTPPAEHHQSELSRRPSGAQLLTRQPTNGGMYDQGYQQNPPVGYSPDSYHSHDGYTYPMHPATAERGMIQSVTPFQAQQYAEITRQLEGPADTGNYSFHPISPVEPIGYAISEEPGESRHGSAQSHEKGLPNPFDEKVARVDSTPPMLPPLGVDDGRLSRTGTPIDPNPQHAHWSYDAKAVQPGTRLSIAGMPTSAANLPTMPPAAYTREDRAVIVGNGEAMPAHRDGKRPVSVVDEDDVYGGM